MIFEVNCFNWQLCLWLCIDIKQLQHLVELVLMIWLDAKILKILRMILKNCWSWRVDTLEYHTWALTVYQVPSVAVEVGPGRWERFQMTALRHIPSQIGVVACWKAKLKLFSQFSWEIIRKKGTLYANFG